MKRINTSSFNKILAIVCLFSGLLSATACKKFQQGRKVQVAPFIKNQLIVIYPPGLTAAAKDTARAEIFKGFPIERIERCICDSANELITGVGVDKLVGDANAAPSSSRLG